MIDILLLIMVGMLGAGIIVWLQNNDEEDK